MEIVLVLLGAALGMLLTTLVQSEIINRSKKFKAGFNDAFKYYTRTNRGGLYIGGTVILIALFVLPNVSAMSWFNPDKLRFYSIFLGIGSQALGFLLVKRTHEEIDNSISKI